MNIVTNAVERSLAPSYLLLQTGYLVSPSFVQDLQLIVLTC